MWHFIALAVVYLLVVQGVSVLTNDGTDNSDALLSPDRIMVTLFIPLGLGIMLLLAVAPLMRSWEAIFSDPNPVSKKMLVVPAAVLIAALITINYSGLVGAGLNFFLLLFVGAMMVGFAEEFLYRGIGVAGLRSAGYSEVKVAVWTSVIFGLGHGTNIFLGRSDVVIQMIWATVIGFIFYLVRRATGSLVPGMALHGLWDFSVMSTPVGGAEGTTMPIIGAGLMLLVAAVVVIFWKRMMPTFAQVKPVG